MVIISQTTVARKISWLFFLCKADQCLGEKKGSHWVIFGPQLGCSWAVKYYCPSRVRECNFALSLSMKSTQISVQHRVSIMQVIVLSPRREVSSSLGERSFHLCPIWIFAYFFLIPIPTYPSIVFYFQFTLFTFAII